MSHVIHPAPAVQVASENSSATLRNCVVSSVMKLRGSPLMTVGGDATHAGLMLQNMTYEESRFSQHVTAWNTSEVYSDGPEVVFRVSPEWNGSQVGDVAGTHVAPQPLAEANTSALQFLSLSDGQKVFAVSCWAPFLCAPRVVMP